ncbi:MAG: bifunctional hydroxymethylpyrimidine kinase/phosphomethylpyrimidine kinase [Candidatus Hydrogenedentes bacterium]|nr:bifunctional hydroxymethylpyrimidine kinase/phosphomethylpyrimidine kinase [Candidatus Hydrogenedentota bacterium]
MDGQEGKLPKVLTIAGSDSGGGAGIQADLKTITALRCYGMSVITAVTAQNTLGISGISPIPTDIVKKQIIAIMEDIGADVVKTGMLWDSEIIFAVASVLKGYSFKYLVVDPVLVAKSGDLLLMRECVEVLKKELFPMAWIVTPNIPELEELSGRRISSVRDLIISAEEILNEGSKYVLVKGGHLEEEIIVDRLISADGKFNEYSHPRLNTTSTHGTGCTLSSAIACYLACGYETSVAVGKAIEFVCRAIDTAPQIGKGHGPLNHLWRIPSIE